MGWYIRNIDQESDLHPLIYEIMSAAEERKGEEGARKAGKFLYGILPSSKGYLAYDEENREPCALLLYREEEILFFHVQEEKADLSFYLAEHAFLELKGEGGFLYTLFPRWYETTGQDLLSPCLARLGFTALNLVRMEAALESKAAKDYYSSDFLSPLRAQGYTLTGFKQKAHQREFCQMLIRNPSPLAALLFNEPSQRALEWSYRYAFLDARERERSYPAECSSVVTMGDRMAGALLCDEEGWINQVVVERAHQGRGLARAMVQKAARALPVLGADSMSLAVYRENPQAFEWYGRAGFVEKTAHQVWAWSREEAKE